MKQFSYCYGLQNKYINILPINLSNYLYLCANFQYMKKKNKQQQITEYVKAARRGSREAEIEMYGRPLNYRKVFKSKKVYDRKKYKANDKGLPYFFVHYSSFRKSFIVLFCFVNLLT